MKETTSVKVRIHSVRIFHFKSIELGIIELGKKDYFSLGDDQVLIHDVFGLLGPGGSGKSAVIEACNVVRSVMANGCLPANTGLCIKKSGYHGCGIRTEFLVQGSEKSYIVEYRLALDHQKYNLDPEKPGISFEMIKARVWDPEKQNFGCNSLILGESRYGSVDQSIVFHPKTRRALRDSAGGNPRQSCFFSPEAQNIIAGSECRSDNRLRPLKLSILKEILPVLTEFAQKQWLIYSQHDFDESLFFPGCGLPFMAGRGGRIDMNDIARNMDKPLIAMAWKHKSYVLPEKEYLKLLETVDQINLVLDTLFPQVQVLIRQTGKFLDKNRNLVIEFSAETQRGEVCIPLKYESRGMQRLLYMLDGIIQAVNNPYVCTMIDDIDTGIFEYLLGEFIKVISETAKGQILFTANNFSILEKMDRKNIYVIIEDEHNQFVHLPQVKNMHNLRDMYYRCLVLAADSERYMPAIKESEIRRALRKAGHFDENTEAADEIAGDTVLDEINEDLNLDEERIIQARKASQTEKSYDDDEVWEILGV